ncbi:MAG: hypothetical protein KAX15_02765 [Candidatus Omnitrophica bacterium]|nr:hypothetical protein [Candidatus Omnitrophota bacterium]
MATTVREKILENIETALGDIKIANGYENDIDSVQRWKQAGNSTKLVPCIILSAGPEEKTPGDPLISCMFNVNVEVWIRHDEETVPGSTDTILNSLLGDVEKALAIDETRGGNATDTVITGNMPFETVEGQAYAGISVDVRIHYRHKRGDPTQVM